MGFDPATLMTAAIAALLTFGALIVAPGLRDERPAAATWWVASFLLGAGGFALLLLAPESAHALNRELANIVFLLAYGCCHAGARCLAGRPPKIVPVLAGGVTWMVVCWVFDAGAPVRMAIASTTVTLYMAATAVEFARGAAAEERARRGAAWLCAVHGAFFFARIVLGPTFGLRPAWSESAISFWGAAMALEVILFAGALAAFVVAIGREQTAAAARRLANTDRLTGIGNRRAFETDAPRLIAADGETPFLLLLDLDRFKQVNDRHGHAAGDRLLVAFTQLIAPLLPEPALFWRLGGDEFAVLLRHVNPNGAQRIIEQLEQATAGSPELRTAAPDLAVSVTIGATPCASGQSIATLLGLADLQLYAGKDRGVGGKPPDRLLRAVG